MEVSGPASSAVGRPLTEDEMADVKKEASAGPDSGRGAARCEAEAPLERAGGASQRGVPRRVPGQRAGQGRAERGGGGPETRGSAPARAGGPSPGPGASPEPRRPPHVSGQSRSAGYLKRYPAGGCK